LAGFPFFGNYNKPGPGVSKDEPQKAAFFRFFQLYFRKFMNLIQLNLLFLVPAAVVGFLIYLFGRLTAQPFLVNLPVILLSPFWAGMTFVTRNYAREEHAFLFSDFKDAVLANWKQFSVNGVVCYAAFSLISFCLSFYYSMSHKNVLFTVAFGISVAIMMVFLFSQYYVPLMIVTFDLKLKQLYKNALIFAIVGLWRNILLTVIFAVLVFLHYFLYLLASPLTLLINGLFLALFTFSFVSFLINFAIYPLIEKMMIQPYQEKTADQSEPQEGAHPGFGDSADGDGDGTVFKDR